MQKGNAGMYFMPQDAIGSLGAITPERTAFDKKMIMDFNPSGSKDYLTGNYNLMGGKSNMENYEAPRTKYDMAMLKKFNTCGGGTSEGYCGGYRQGNGTSFEPSPNLVYAEPSDNPYNPYDKTAVYTPML